MTGFRYGLFVALTCVALRNVGTGFVLGPRTSAPRSIATRPRASWQPQSVERIVARRAEADYSQLIVAGSVLIGAVGFSFLQSKGARPAVELEERFFGKLQQKISGSEAADGDLDSIAAELAALQQPFEAERLGGGKWCVAWSRGDLVWQRWTQVLPKFSQGRPNQSSQTYDPVARSLVNEAQLLGDLMYVRVSGSFAAPPVNARCPVQFPAFVDGGVLSVLGSEIPLPIKGTGTVLCLYAGERVRVFGSRGDSGYEESDALTVQIPLDEWEALYGGK